jgi:hypothetical protein
MAGHVARPRPMLPAGLRELTPPSRHPPDGRKRAQREPEVVPRAEWQPHGAREQAVVDALKAGTTDFASMLAAFVSAPPPRPRPPMTASQPQPVPPSRGTRVPPPPLPRDRMGGSLGASCSSSCDGCSESPVSRSTSEPPAAAASRSSASAAAAAASGSSVKPASTSSAPTTDPAAPCAAAPSAVPR